MAALGVIWGHSMYSLGLPVELNGAFWVWVFLAISGYLVGRSFDRDGYSLSVSGFGRFLRNRSLRIIPLAEVALVLGLLIAWSSGAGVPPTALRQFLFVPPRNEMSLVGPLWTIATEMQFYVASALLVPATVWIWRRGGAIAAMAFWAATFVVADWSIAWVGDLDIQPRMLAGNLAFFMFGLVLAPATAMRLRHARSVQLALVLAGVALAWWLQNYKPEYFWRWREHATWPFGAAAAVALLIAAAVVLFVPSDEAPRSPWRASPAGPILAALAWCGVYTYGIYVWHSVLAMLNTHVLHVPVGPARLALLALAVPLAPLSYRLIEGPWLRLKIARRDRVPAAESAHAPAV